MTANRISESKVSVGATFALLSAWNASKTYTIVSADAGNTQLLYVGGTSSVATASGFGELSAGQTVTILGAAAVYGIAGGSSQNARVVEGFK